MGEKNGLNGLDNGFLLFKNYSLPREYLLNKIADVSKDGIYNTSVKNQDKRFGKICLWIFHYFFENISISNLFIRFDLNFFPNILLSFLAKFLSPLSNGRVGITLHATMFSRLALTIATRYCAVRRQFGANENEEEPVIEYQVQVLMKIFYFKYFCLYFNFSFLKNR